MLSKSHLKGYNPNKGGHQQKPSPAERWACDSMTGGLNQGKDASKGRRLCLREKNWGGLPFCKRGKTQAAEKI